MRRVDVLEVDADATDGRRNPTHVTGISAVSAGGAINAATAVNAPRIPGINAVATHSKSRMHSSA
jgi:hypothetical protein